MTIKLRGISVDGLSLKDALDLAILIEQEAEERYEELASQMEIHHSEEPAKFFRFMAGNEKKHGVELSARRKMLFGDEPRSVRRTMIFDIEAPDYDEARAFMYVREALDVAMHAEKKAHAFFDAALPGLADPEVIHLFTELREEEVHHQDLILREIAKLPAEANQDTLPADAFEDDPIPL